MHFSFFRHDMFIISRIWTVLICKKIDFLGVSGMMNVDDK